MTKIKKVSCLPCRLKKVKCDGEHPCQRCQSKNQSCVYQKPKTVGRPPKNAVINKLVLSRLVNNSQTHHALTTSEGSSNACCREFIFENVSDSLDLTPVRYLKNSRQHGLEFYASQLFTHIFTKVYANSRFVQASLMKTQRTNTNSFAVTPKIKVFDMTHFFIVLSSDIANILARKTSRLRLVYYDELTFSTYGLKYDSATAFFETPGKNALVSNPLNSLPPQQAVRLIECFFAIHPYSILFSKTTLLQSYWTDTADPFLLTVIYGTTVYKSQLLDGKPLVFWEALEKKSRNPFLDYAYVLLSKANAEATPSRYQAIVLLALFEVLWGYPKRGMALFALSHMLASKLGLHDNTLPSTLNPVEKELLSMTFWALFNCAIRGCIELERLPKSALVNHVLPYPPMNIKKSKAYHFDLENEHPRTFKNIGYLIETFYLKSVICRVTCKLISYLPDTFVSVSVFNNSKRLPVIEGVYSPEEAARKSQKIQQNLDRVLADFKEFIRSNKKDFSATQLFTCELYHSFYLLCLSFLRDSSKGIHFPYSIYPNKPEQLDLTNLDHVIKINQLVPEAIALIEKCFNFVSESKNYFHNADFLPKSIMMNGLDAAVQVLMYSYQLAQSNRVRQSIQLTKIIVSLSNVWDDWSAADLMKSVIDQFLEQHPVIDEQTNDTSSTNSSSGESTDQFDSVLEENNNIFDILGSNNITFPLLQQPSFPLDLLSVNNSHLNLMNNPWLSGNEPWMQNINANLFPEEQPVFVQEQEDQQQQQQQFLNQIEFINMFDNIV